jgi:rhodanese-related sulfurtransferase
MVMKQDELLKIYDDATANLLLLDVRTPYEFNEGHLLGSINIPIDDIEKRLREIPLTKRIITICKHGVRSGIVAAYLKAKGYQAESLDGGLSLWKGQIN